MKVVLFCGGKSLRLRGYFSDIPKPMVQIGSHPILWHVMKYYAHYGHKEFILCLGHQGDTIKKAFSKQQETRSQKLNQANGTEKLHSTTFDIGDWKISFVETGRDASVGERLVAVRSNIGDDDIFLANYADGVTDLHLPAMLDPFLKGDRVATCIAVRPTHSFHVIEPDENGIVRSISAAADAGFRINGGYFAFRKEIFDFIEDGEDLLEEPFGRLSQIGMLSAYSHDGFWACMDTFKEKMMLDEIHAAGNAPWEVWNEVDELSMNPLKKATTI